MGFLFLGLLNMFHILLWVMLSKRVVGVVGTRGKRGKMVKRGHWHARVTNWTASSSTRTDGRRERGRPTQMGQTSSRVGQPIWECMTPGRGISMCLLNCDFAFVT